ncbi:KAT8 regulatory NSL complex subunit 2 [Tetranychus urticae]|uniref:KAT8 regulatory NSL complex subunit 2 n=1 Tax=Tetranychus urticae TaxID=32264 RepID=T1KTE6_TETUR|nr:KAT8 regulatory NSL complex subunit 2 [Tetranychus urticae]
MNRSSDGKELCSYIHRICLQNKLDGFDYCIRHILVDKSAPFKQCTFIHPISNKRCPNAARKSERSSQILCPWHIKKMFLKSKHHQLHQQLQQNIEEAKAKREGLSGLLLQLEHYAYSQDPTKRRANINWVKQDDDNSITASDYLRNKISEAAVESLDQESDEESSNPMLEDVLRPDLLDSDSENFDSDQDDPLKHAGVYTAEEVSLILRDKMLKLQSLYIGQFKHLQYLLREKYKKYIQSLQIEKEAEVLMGDAGDCDGSDSSYSEDDVYKLRALVKYHRYRGPEALLKDKAREKRRALLEGENFKPKIYAKCIFNKEVQCQNQALPLSHYCKSHILYDSNQVLFRPCAAGEPPCFNPVISIRRHHTCMLHSDLKQNPEIDNLVLNLEK